VAEDVAHFVVLVNGAKPRGDHVCAVGDRAVAKCGKEFTVEIPRPLHSENKLPVCRPCLFKHIEEGHGCQVAEWA